MNGKLPRSNGFRFSLKERRECEEHGHVEVHVVAEARDKGDLSENAEYDAAKEAKASLAASASLWPLPARFSRIRIF